MRMVVIKTDPVEKQEFKRAELRNEMLGVHSIHGKFYRRNTGLTKKVKTAKMVKMQLEPKELYRLKKRMERIRKVRMGA